MLSLLSCANVGLNRSNNTVRAVPIFGTYEDRLSMSTRLTCREMGIDRGVGGKRVSLLPTSDSVAIFATRADLRMLAQPIGQRVEKRNQVRLVRDPSIVDALRGPGRV